MSLKVNLYIVYRLLRLLLLVLPGVQECRGPREVWVPLLLARHAPALRTSSAAQAGGQGEVEY